MNKANMLNFVFLFAATSVGVVVGQTGVGTACTAYGVAGTCQTGVNCDGNWFPTISGAVSGCGSFASNVRCCVRACEGNSLPGICASACDSRLPPRFSAASANSVGCPASSVCCVPNDLAAEVAQAKALQSRVALPARLSAGDKVALVATSSAIAFTPSTLPSAVQAIFGPLGLNVVYGDNIYASGDSGRVAGTDAQRAADLMKAFADKSVKAIVSIGGGWGCARIIDLLDYSVIRANPKPLMGYSDVSACIAAIVWRAGFTSMVGPLISSDWTNGNGNFARRALMSSLPFAMTSFSGQTPSTVVPGKATGRLVGGNLSVLSAMIGAQVPVFPADGEQLILIIEDVGEEMYRIDRLLSTMELNGLLARINGFVFGTCSMCDKIGTVESVVRRLMLKLNKPAVYGVSFGHHGEQFTVPIGQEAILDADRQQLFLVRAATQASTPSLSPYVARTACQGAATGPVPNPAPGIMTVPVPVPCPPTPLPTPPPICSCPSVPECKCPDCNGMTQQAIIVTQPPVFVPATTCPPCATCPAAFCPSSANAPLASLLLVALAVAATTI